MQMTLGNMRGDGGSIDGITGEVNVAAVDGVKWYAMVECGIIA